MKVITIILLLLITHRLFSQATIQETPQIKISGSYIKSYLQDTRDIFISPLRWDKKQLIAAGLLMGTTSLLITQDKKIHDFAQKNRTAFTEDITKYGLEPFAHAYTFGTLGLMYIHGEISDNNRTKRTAFLGAKAYILSGLIVRIPKEIFGRHRPYNDDPANPYIWEGLKGDKTSFVSGHTTTAFAVATIIASEYKDKTWVPILSYTIAGLTGLSRIHDNKHWASDVLGGAALGFAISKLIYNRNNWGINLNVSYTPVVQPTN